MKISVNGYHYFLLIFVSLIWSCDHNDDNTSNIRPADFPVFLQTPEQRVNVWYCNAETGGTASGTYSLNYLIEEEFPPRSTMEFIENKLLSADFFRVKYLLQSPPNIQVGYQWQADNLFEPGYIHLVWAEQWIHKNKCEFVGVRYLYRYEADEEVPMEVDVAVLYFTENTGKAAEVKRYKELYPEEDREIDSSEIDFSKVIEAM